MVERMQLLYGNDGTNYHTIASSKDMTAVQERELLESYLGYDFVRDSSLYSDVSFEPVSITYVTTDLSNTLEQEKILIAKNARMKNYLTPSYYAHFQLMEMSEELYGKRFMELLRYSFIEDTDLSVYEDRDIDSFRPLLAGMPVSSDAIDKERLIPIIASVLDAADGISKQVNIVLDVMGDAYNKRALEVIATIYKYLPYNIRKKVGFTTYAKTESASSGRIKLKLYTRDALDRLGRNAIDLQNMDSGKLTAKLPDMAVNLARDFVQQSDAQREEWFEAFKLVFQLKNVSVEDHVSFFKNLRSWQNDDLEKIKDNIAVYAAAEANKTPESPVFTMFKNIISNRFQKEQFLPRYQEMIRQLLMRNESFVYDNRLKAYIMLGEALESVQFLPNVFVEWEDEKIIRKEENEYEDMELYTRLRTQYQSVHDMRCGQEKFRMIQTVMQDHLKKHMEKLKKQILQNIETEKRNISGFLEAQRIEHKSLPLIADKFVHIKYKDNKAVFKKVLYEQAVQELSGTAYFRSMEMLQRCRKLLDEYRDYLTEEDYQNLMDIAKHKGEIVEEMEKIKMIDWNDKIDVLRTYRNIADMKSVSEGKMVDVPDFVLHIGRDSFTLSGGQLETLAEFLLVPTDRNVREFEHIVRRMSGLLDSIYIINVFGEAHFCYLMEMARGEKEEQKRVLKYYLSGDALLSPEKIKTGLYQVETDLLSDLQDEAGKNILGTVIQNKLMIRSERNEKRAEIKSIAVNEYEEKGISIPLIVLLAVIMPMMAFAMVFFMSSIVKFGLSIMLIISLVLIFMILICLFIPKRSSLAKAGGIGCGIGAGLSILAVWAWYLLVAMKS